MVGKGHKAGKVVLPPLARGALDGYLVQRGLPVTPSKWCPSAPLVGSLDDEGNGISDWRLWRVMKVFFTTAAGVVEESNPALAEKLPSCRKRLKASHRRRL